MHIRGSTPLCTTKRPNPHMYHEAALAGGRWLPHFATFFIHQDKRLIFDRHIVHDIHVC